MHVERDEIGGGVSKGKSETGQDEKGGWTVEMDVMMARLYD